MAFETFTELTGFSNGFPTLGAGIVQAVDDAERRLAQTEAQVVALIAELAEAITAAEAGAAANPGNIAWDDLATELNNYAGDIPEQSTILHEQNLALPSIEGAIKKGHTAAVVSLVQQLVQLAQ